MSNMKYLKKQKGFSLIEIVIYLSLLIIVSVLVIQSLLSLFKNYNVVRANQELESTAVNIIDKINRDVKDSQGVLIEQSLFLIPQGVLTLNNSSTSTTKFSYENNRIKYYKNDNFIANLSNKSINVNNFKVYLIQSTSTKAVRVYLGLDVKPHLSQEVFNKTFHTTIQLRK